MMLETIASCLTVWILGQAADEETVNTTMTQLGNAVPMVMMFLVVYFMWLRPQRKQQKDHELLIEGLKKDDEVLTSSGFYGRIVQLDERVITLEIADKVKIRLLRDRIVGYWSKATTAAGDKSATGKLESPSQVKDGKKAS